MSLLPLLLAGLLSLTAEAAVIVDQPHRSYRSIQIPEWHCQNHSASPAFASLAKLARSLPNHQPPVNIVVLGAGDTPLHAALDLKNVSLESCITKLCDQLGWKVQYNESAVVVGPPAALQAFDARWKKKPAPAPGGDVARTTHFEMMEAEPHEVADFLNEMALRVTGKQCLHLHADPALKTHLVLFGEELSFFDVTWLTAAAAGGTPDKIFGPTPFGK